MAASLLLRAALVVAAVALLARAEAQTWTAGVSNPAWKAAQSSTASGAAAGRAIDGNTNPVFAGGSCTATAATAAPSWWTLDLGSVQTTQLLVGLTIWNRQDANWDRLRNFVVYGSQDFLFTNSTPSPNATVCYTYPDQAPTTNANAIPAITIRCDTPIPNVRYISIQTAKPNAVLTLCEVQPSFIPVLYGQWLTRPWVAASSGEAYAGLASRAIDGNANAAYAGGSCMHTTNSSRPWLSIDLGPNAVVGPLVGVNLVNRGDACCSARLANVEVRAGSANPYVQGIAANPLCFSSAAALPGGANQVLCAQPLSGVRYLTVQITSAFGILSVCEVTPYFQPVWYPGPAGVLAASPLTQSAPGMALPNNTLDGNAATCYKTADGTLRPWHVVDLGQVLDSSLAFTGVDVVSSDALSNLVVGVSSASPFTQWQLDYSKTTPCIATPRALPAGSNTLLCAKPLTSGVRYITLMVQSTAPANLTLCEVTPRLAPAWSAGSGAVALQSSTRSNYSARLAVDGYITTSFGAGDCATTMASQDPFWVMDLAPAGANTTRNVMTAITLWTGTGADAIALANVEIRAGPNNPVSAYGRFVASVNPVCYAQAAPVPAGNWSVSCVSARSSVRYVSIQVLGSGQTLSLCEVFPNIVTDGWSNWGSNIRNLHWAKTETKITTSNVAQLSLAWSIPLNRDVSAVPTVVGGRVYWVDWRGGVWCSNAKNGALIWSRTVGDLVKEAGLPVSDANKTSYVTRTSPAVSFNIAVIGTRIRGTKQGLDFVFGLDAFTGRLRWWHLADDHIAAVVTMSPTIHRDGVYVGVASNEEVLAVSASYPCCTFRGSMLRINLFTGARVWKTYMVPDNGGDPKQFSGAGVWGSSPSIDEQRSQVYVATGNLYGVPVAMNTCLAEAQRKLGTNDTFNADYIAASRACETQHGASAAYYNSMVALDLDTGIVKWAAKLGAADVWTMVCRSNASHPNCPKLESPDFDFGAAPMLVRPCRDGQCRDLVVAGQKSGWVWALKPEDGGLVWGSQVGPGSASGGMQWGSASDDVYVYVQNTNGNGVPIDLTGLKAVANVPGQQPPTNTTGGLCAALDALTGELVWTFPAPTPYKTMAAPSVANGVVFYASYDFAGSVWCLDARTGGLLGSFSAGGSVASGLAIADGMVFVGSGYPHSWGSLPSRFSALSVPA